jgi:DNA-binding NarL/FixJ family response regulator
VLAHDHVLLRQGLRRLLRDEPDLEVVSEAGNAAECLRKVYEYRPDVVIADAATFGLPAAEAALLLSRESPHTNLVFLSMQEQASSGFDGLQTAQGTCTARHTSVEELVEMVLNSCRGHASDDIATDRDSTNRDSANYGTPNHRTPNRQEANFRRDPQRSTEMLVSQERALTTREREVLKLLAEGKTVRAAATVLGLSSKTVDAHKFNLMRKLGIHNKAELVMWAIQKRVVKIPANF